MTIQPTDSDLEALVDAGVVMRYATQSKLTLDPAIVQVVFEAREANDNGTWTVAIAAKFWTAFSSLCSLINPATVDSVYANQPTEPRSHWYVRLFHARPVISVAERSAQRYMALTLLLLALTTGLTYAVNTSNAGINGVYDRIQSDATYTALAASIAQHEGALREKSPNGSLTVAPTAADADLRSAALKLQADVTTLVATMDQAKEETSLLPLFVLFKPFKAPLFKGATPTTIDEAKAAFYDFGTFRGRLAVVKARMIGISKFITDSLLPILLGLLGASANVVRSISDEIKTTTYSRTATTQHLVRVGLGALAGIVIGFAFVLQQTSATITAAAWSFVAGYAIEPVFAVIDSFAEKLKGLKGAAGP